MSDLLSQLKSTLAVQPPELTAYYGASRFDHAAKRINEWIEWKKIAAEFLPGAVSIEVEVESEYNDEGGYDERIVDIHGKAADGSAIHMDDAKKEEFWDVKYEWDIPSAYSLNFTKPPCLGTSRTFFLDNIEPLRAWIQSLPDDCFVDF